MFGVAVQGAAPLAAECVEGFDGDVAAGPGAGAGAVVQCVQ
jgi:hypothetical protein